MSTNEYINGSVIGQILAWTSPSDNLSGTVGHGGLTSSPSSPNSWDLVYWLLRLASMTQNNLCSSQTPVVIPLIFVCLLRPSSLGSSSSLPSYLSLVGTKWRKDWLWRSLLKDNYFVRPLLSLGEAETKVHIRALLKAWTAFCFIMICFKNYEKKCSWWK